jgi:hypothetical protein
VSPSRVPGGILFGTAPVALLLAATLAGCGGSDGDGPGPSTTGPGSGASASGGSGTSAGAASTSYEQAGAVLCRRLFDQNRALPQLQRDEHLTISELEARAKKNSDRFVIDFAALRPTGDDARAHQRLVAFMRAQSTEPPAKDPETAIRGLERTAKAYETAGQTTCARLVRDGIEQQRSAARTSPHK